MTLIVDASVVTAALVDTGPDGRWAEQFLTTENLVALAAGEATGSYVTFVYTDSVDAALAASTANYDNETMMGHFTALGIQIVSRAISVTH